jgi:hypothetical protein
VTATTVGLALALSFAGYTAVARVGTASARQIARAGRPAPAKTKSKSTASTASYGILIGPLRTKTGFTVQLQVNNCGTKTSGLLVDYEQGNAAAALDHSYEGPAPDCSVTPTLGASVLKVKWGGVLDFNLKLSGTGKLDMEKVDSTCGSSFFESRTARSSGSGVITIHSGALGRVSFSKVTAHVLGEGSTGCEASSGGSGTLPLSSSNTKWFGKSRQLTTAVDEARGSAVGQALARSQGTTTIPGPVTTTPTASTTLPTIDADGSGSRFLSVFDRPQSLVITASSLSPYNPLTIINDEKKDAPASGVSGSMAVALNTSDAFTVDSGDSNAQLVANAVFAKGILNFTATRDCTSVKDALDGTLSGTIVVKDPIFGTITYDGADAIGAAVGNADASLDTC